MRLSDLQRYLNPIRRKLYMMMGKALLTAVNNSGEVGFYAAGDRKNPQRLNMDWLGTLTDIERAQPYGFESYPIVGTAKNIILAQDGSRQNAFVVMVQDDEYRPTDGSEGDTIFYGKNDKTSGEKHRVHFKNDGSIEVWAGKTNKVVIAKDGDIDVESATNCNITVGGNAVIDVAKSADIDVGEGCTLDVTDQIDCTTPFFNLTGALNVTENITCEKDVIWNNSVAAMSGTNHFHLGNLSYNTAPPTPIGVAGTPKPGTSPTGDSSGNLLMNGKYIDMGGGDITNLPPGSHSYSGHKHTDSVGGATTVPF